MGVGLEQLTAFSLVLVRTAGMFAFNPLLSRRNVPAMVRTGLTLMITLLLSPMAAAQMQWESDGTLSLLFAMMRELFVGFVCGMVFLIFYYMIFTAGDLMDTQMGLSMAKVFDPGTSIQASVSGNLLSILFILLFFYTDSHLIFLRLYASSYTLIPLGGAVATGEISSFFIMLFSSVFSLALRLAMPFIAAELVVEISMGILMKLIPQIHVFVINIQLKVALGLLLLLLFAQPVADFLDLYLEAMMKSMQQALVVLAG